MDPAYFSIAAFILQTNGARAGTQEITANTNTTIRTVATGVALAQAAGGRGGRGAERRAAAVGVGRQRRWLPEV